MIIKVHPHTIEIVESEPINEKEVKISKCKFIFDEDMEIPNDYVKEAYFTLNGHTYKKILINDECDYPNEVLAQKGELEIGIVVFKEENEEYVKLYNPTPVYFATWKGSMKEAQNSVPITPSDKEQMEQMLANINIDAEKVGRITTITYVNKDGVPHYVTLEDGKSIEYDWNGTYLGIRQEGQSEYEYVNLKGEKGDPGAIKIQIVVELPETGQDDTFYLVPYDEIVVNELPSTGIADTIYIVSSTNKRYVYESNQWIEIGNDNKFKEYIWVNNSWERVGQIGIEVDLTDYVKNTDYASSNKGGVFKTGFGIKQLEGTIAGETYSYSDYQGWRDLLIIDKGTLENVIEGKELVSKSVDNLTNYTTTTNMNILLNGKQDKIDNDHKLPYSLISGTPDLTDYVKNTDYATSSTGGVIKTLSTYAIDMINGNLYANNKNYTDYGSLNNNAFISKGTLENVITGKDLTTKAYVDGLVGDINTALDTINGEVI